MYIVYCILLHMYVLYCIALYILYCIVCIVYPSDVLVWITLHQQREPQITCGANYWDLKTGCCHFEFDICGICGPLVPYMTYVGHMYHMWHMWHDICHNATYDTYATNISLDTTPDNYQTEYIRFKIFETCKNSNISKMKLLEIKYAFLWGVLGGF